MLPTWFHLWAKRALAQEKPFNYPVLSQLCAYEASNQNKSVCVPFINGKLKTHPNDTVTEAIK